MDRGHYICRSQAIVGTIGGPADPLKAGGTGMACFFLCCSFGCKVNATSDTKEGGKPPMATPNSLQNSEVVVDTSMLRLFSRFASSRPNFFGELRFFLRIGRR
jgi:hypothetical protein